MSPLFQTGDRFAQPHINRCRASRGAYDSNGVLICDLARVRDQARNSSLKPIPPAAFTDRLVAPPARTAARAHTSTHRTGLPLLRRTPTQRRGSRPRVGGCAAGGSGESGRAATGWVGVRRPLVRSTGSIREAVVRRVQPGCGSFHRHRTQPISLEAQPHSTTCHHE